MDDRCARGIRYSRGTSSSQALSCQEMWECLLRASPKRPMEPLSTFARKDARVPDEAEARWNSTKAAPDRRGRALSRRRPLVSLASGTRTATTLVQAGGRNLRNL